MTVPAAKSSSKRPPGLVIPRHIMSDPPKTCLIAPVSTWTLGHMKGSSGAVGKSMVSAKFLRTQQSHLLGSKVPKGERRGHLKAIETHTCGEDAKRARKVHLFLGRKESPY